MILIEAKGQTASLDKNIVAKFTYNFFIGKHEVTCAEFGSCKGDSLPQVDVTFYDAVLFANKRSQEEGFDTAYTYSDISYDSEGRVTLLKNFSFHPEVKAYRLPTEAEWVLAASESFDVGKSWNADNSDYEAHPICSFENERICDMAGNVAEWVYDWLHKISDTTVTNFIGPANPNSLEERILKGGNFKNNPKAISIINRKDIYTVTSTSYADYVGFRLAFGAIPNATWTGDFIKDSTDSSNIDSASADTLSKDSVKTEGVLDADSAGAYYKSGGSENAIMLRYKMELLWQFHEQSQLVILGSSRSLYGVNPMLMDSNLNAINMSHIPNSLFASDFLFRNYLVNHFKKLKHVVLSLDIDMWWRDENDSYDNFFLSEYRIYPGYAYDENHDFWKDGYPEGLLEKTKAAPGFDGLEQLYLPHRGFVAEPTGSWEENPTVDYDSTWLDKKSDLYKANFKKLEEIIVLAHDQGIHVVGIIFPQSPAYKNTGAYARYGFRRSEANTLIQQISDLSKVYPNFILMDEYKGGDHDYTDDMASNKDHLNEKGAGQLTNRLDSLIKILD